MGTWERLKDDFGVVRRGDDRLRVKSVQYGLNVGHGYSLVVDQQFGELTENAVRDFQASAGISVDGEVGPITFTALVAEES